MMPPSLRSPLPPSIAANGVVLALGPHLKQLVVSTSTTCCSSIAAALDGVFRTPPKPANFFNNRNFLFGIDSFPLLSPMRESF
jgi:hypothetical protein